MGLLKKEKDRGKELFIINKEGSMKENGSIIVCMGLENFTITQEILHMKVHGRTMSFMEKEKSITIHLYQPLQELIMNLLILMISAGLLIKVKMSLFRRIEARLTRRIWEDYIF